MRGDIEELFVERGLGVGCQLELAMREKQGELLGLGAGDLGRGDDANAQGVAGRENAVVANRVGTRRRALRRRGRRVSCRADRRDFTSDDAGLTSAGSLLAEADASSFGGMRVSVRLSAPRGDKRRRE